MLTICQNRKVILRKNCLSLYNKIDIHKTPQCSVNIYDIFFLEFESKNIKSFFRVIYHVTVEAWPYNHHVTL